MKCFLGRSPAHAPAPASFTSLNGEIFGKSLPLVMSCLLPSLLGVVDGMVLSRHSPEAFRAHALAAPVLALAGAIGPALAMAAANATVRAASDTERRTAVGAALALAVLSGLAVLAAGLAASSALAAAFNLQASSKAELVMFLDYWGIALLSVPAQFLLALFLQMLAARNTRSAGTPVLAAMFAIHLVTSLVLVMHLGMGTMGSGIALNASTMAGAVLAFCIFRRGEDGFALMVPRLSRPLLASLRGQLRYAASIVAVAAVFPLGGVLLAKLASDFGPASVSLFGMARQFMSVFNLATRGVCGAFTIVLAQAMQAGRLDDYARIYWVSTFWVGVLFGAGAAILILFPRAPLFLFGGADVGDAPLAETYFLATGAVLLANTLPRIAQAGFISVGASPVAAVQSLVKVGAGFGAAYWLSRDAGLIGIVWGQLLGDLLVVMIFVPGFLCLLRRRSRAELLLGRAAHTGSPGNDILR